MMKIETGQTKNAEARTVYLDDELKEILITQWEGLKNQRKVVPYVFVDQNGRDMIKGFRKAWE